MEDIQFWHPQKYNYRCCHFSHEMEVNEAIIDVEMFLAQADGSYY
ncbi:MAG TPA: hypothetical protein VJL89_14160 [Thermodesulfovibrionia bacterium]|nr:hypothetical protein [Thermodesulfovibrionia bacterium]